MDYSKMVLSQGLVCFNTNNQNYCVVIDGERGSADDRCSLVLEFINKDGFILHSPPNRALEPTGKICYNQLKFLLKALKQYVVEDDK